MSRFKDLTGQKFGMLTVLKRLQNDKNGKSIWECQCQCGKHINVSSCNLRTQHTKSCGCSRKGKESKQYKDLTGQKFGLLTVIKRVQSDKHGHSIWECQCQCGKHKNIRSHDLLIGNTKSCGCYKIQQQTIPIEKYKKFGLLTFLQYVGHDKYNNILCKCICDCGNTKTLAKGRLLTNSTKSCGCIKSLGQIQTQKILEKYNIQFEREYTFEDLINKSNNKLRFDFALFKDTKLICLIEYQGEQHYNPSTYFGAYQREYSDGVKKEYCKEKNIKLFQIRFDQDIEQKIKYILDQLNIKE